MNESYKAHLDRVDESGMHRKAARLRRLTSAMFREEWVGDAMRGLVEESECLDWAEGVDPEKVGRRIPHYDVELLWEPSRTIHGELFPVFPDREGAVSDWKTAVILREVGEPLLTRMAKRAAEGDAAVFRELANPTKEMTDFIVSSMFVVWVDDEQKNGRAALRLVV